MVANSPANTPPQPMQPRAQCRLCDFPYLVRAPLARLEPGVGGVGQGRVCALTWVREWLYRICIT
eukprot:12660508-Alexandrium_andersonii.AAC.1